MYNFSKRIPKMAKILHQISTWFESPKYLHQTTFETLKECRANHVLKLLIQWKCEKKWLSKEEPKKKQILWATLSFQKITMNPQKVALSVKNSLIWSPWLGQNTSKFSTLKVAHAICLGQVFNYKSDRSSRLPLEFKIWKIWRSQRTFKNVNNDLNINIYSYLETSVANPIKLFLPVNFTSEFSSEFYKEKIY